jgi:predicted XRE-type DNA-binding protein
MKSKRGNSGEAAPHLTRGNALDDLGFSPAEALEIKIKAEIYHDLLNYIREQEYAQSELGVLLGLHQPDVSNLLNGRVSKFSVGKLIKLAGKLNLGAEVKITRPKARKLPRLAATGTKQKHSSAAA